MSCAVAFTPKGDQILKQCNCEFVEHSFEIVAEGQQKKCAKCSSFIKVCIIKSLKADKLDLAYKIAYSRNKVRRLTNRLRHPMRSMKNLLAKLKYKRIFMSRFRFYNNIAN